MKNLATPLTYLPDDEGAPIVDATGARVCDMDCADYYEIADSVESAELPARVAVYEERRNQYARLFVAAPALLQECKGAQDELATAIRDHGENLNLDMLNRWFKAVSEVIDIAEGKDA